MENIRNFMKLVPVIKMREPLAGILGAFEDDNHIFEYSFLDVVKMAGHSCPTVSAAYIGALNALKKLYPDSIPVRGEIAIISYGSKTEGVYGVIAQVFSLITGACGEKGFKGIGENFKRMGLQKFNPEKKEPELMCFEFKRMDNGNKVLLKIDHSRLPSIGELKNQRMGELMGMVMGKIADKSELREFQDLWMEKVEKILNQKNIEQWISIV